MNHHQQPEASIGNAANLFGPDGALTSDPVREFAMRFIQAFAAWVAAHPAGHKG